MKRLAFIAVLLATAAAAETITVIKPGPASISITSSTGPNVTVSSGATTTTTVVVPGPQGSPGGPIGPTGIQGDRGYDGRPGSNGYDGRPGLQSIFCSISGGTRSITYDQVGLNPLPTQTPFSYMGQLVNLLRIAWNTGAGVLSGTSGTTSFTPTVSSSNLFGNNYIGVMATYSTASVNGGKRYCAASVPISVTQIGTTGAKGDTGQSVSVTEPTVMAAFNAANSSSALVLQADPGQVRTKIDVRDGAAATKFYVNSNGAWSGGTGNITGTLTATAVVPTITSAINVSGAYPLNLSSFTVYKLTLTGTTTFSISNPRAVDSFTLYLLQGNGSGSYTLPVTTSFGRTASAPVMSTTVDSKDAIDCRTVDTGVTWQCNYAGY